MNACGSTDSGILRALRTRGLQKAGAQYQQAPNPAACAVKSRFCMAAPKLSTAKSRSNPCLSTSGNFLKPSIVKHARISTGAVAKRSRRSMRFSSSVVTPSLLRSTAHASAICSAKSRLIFASRRIMKRQHCELCAEGAQPAASKTSHTNFSGTSLGWYFRILRRCLIASCKFVIKER